MTRSVVVLAAAVLIPSVAGAQPASSPTISLTLDDAIRQGLAASERLAELQARKEAASATVDARAAADRPLVAAEGGYTRTNHVDEFAITVPGAPPRVVYPDIPDNYRTRLDLQWPIYTGGRSDALERAARAERSATGEDLAAARADLRFEITRAFWALVTADETAAVLQRSLEAIDAQVTDLRTRFEQGLIAPNDVSSAEAQQAHQRLLAIEAGNQRSIAEADLRRLTGNESAGRLVAEAGPALEAPARATQANLASLIDEAMTSRPERKALQDRVAAAADQVAAAAAAWHPQVSLGGGYDYARPNPRIFPRSRDWRTSWDASVNVTWTLWDGGRRAADRRLASANQSALRARAAEFDRSLTFEVRQRRYELDSSLAGIGAADEEVRAARDAERVVGERYRSGVATSTDVLEAQVARLQAELDRTRAVANVRLAEARLARATGTQP